MKITHHYPATIQPRPFSQLFTKLSEWKVPLAPSPTNFHPKQVVSSSLQNVIKNNKLVSPPRSDGRTLTELKGSPGAPPPPQPPSQSSGPESVLDWSGFVCVCLRETEGGGGAVTYIEIKVKSINRLA